LDGLLQINPILALPTGANRPIASTSDRIGNPQLVTQHVRIDMGQMVQLKEMGYEVSGPVNGPNEGLPEFEVPEHWLKSLTSEPPLIPNESPCAIPGKWSHIDPALRSQSTSPPTPDNPLAGPSAPLPLSPSERPPSPSQSIPKAAPTRQLTSKKRLGKKRDVPITPRTTCQAHAMSKRKKLTDDDRAAREAEEMGELGTRQRKKPTRHR
jgi:hypothetical protein